VAGLRCLDIGQSTGGFTDCLLQHGAAQVVGVDVGHGQLHGTLRDDARVVCIEGVNARSMTADDLAEHYHRALNADEDGAEEADDGDFNPEFDFLTGDLSFISLTLVLPAVVRLLKADGQLLMLVKPQFELQPGQIGKGGIVRDAAHFEFVEKRLRDSCTSLGLEVKAWLESPIAGGDGNREFFIHAQKGHETAGEDQPLAAVPKRQSPKRLPRSTLREMREPHEDSEAAELAHAGQHGPARSKRRNKNLTNE
jgi:23S rRNA (cytidine1920-2'-O)/16S rRNA (cytidine1409-2'-O)-methyltransferase